MHIVVKFVIAFFALGLIFLGFIFLIAGGTDNITVGAVMVLAGFGLFAFLYYDSQIVASQPKVVPQDIAVPRGGSGEFQKQKLNCPSCGAPVEAKDVTLMSGGLVVNCPYCNAAAPFRHAHPQWTPTFHARWAQLHADTPVHPRSHPGSPPDLTCAPPRAPPFPA